MHSAFTAELKQKIAFSDGFLCPCRALQMMRERTSPGNAAGHGQQRLEPPKRTEERPFGPRIGAHKQRIGTVKGCESL